MNICVRYFSRSGNTKNVAEAIASAGGVKAESVETGQLKEDVDILFIGGAIYAGKIDKNLREFIENINVNIKRAAVFTTSGSDKPADAEISGLLSHKGIEVLPEKYHCKGKFMLFNKGRPNERDLELAGKFANNILNKI